MVNYDLLTHHVANMGIQGFTLKRLISFLQYQRQRVALGDKVLPRQPLVCEVPQEAILSPLFNIYMHSSSSCY